MKGKMTFLLYATAFLMLMAGYPAGMSSCAWAQTSADAQTLKEEGDRLAREGHYARAADVYDRALVATHGFSDTDRLEMATVLAWGGKLERSEQELMALLQKRPNFTKARTQLGRVFFWKGQHDRALTEAEKALVSAPEDREALLLKADIARVSLKPESAVALYAAILKKEEYFEARNGLSYAYLAAGNPDEAARQAELLKPTLPYQHQEAEKLKLAIAEARKPKTQTPQELARQSLVTGNRLADEGRHSEAADAYRQALAFSGSYTVEEQLRMATVISWAGDLCTSRKLLRGILEKNPGMAPARIHLARVLLWSGAFDAALREVETVLALDKNNRQALLVRASALRLKRNYRQSIALYRELIQKLDDFDAREGLTYAYLASGDRIETDRNLPLLKPAFPYEEKSLAELKEARDIAFNPSIAPGVSFYSDSDQNSVWRIFGTGTVWLGNWRTRLDYQHIGGSGPSVNGSAENLMLSTYARLPFYGGIGGGIGFADSARVLAWNVRGDVDIPNGTIGARAGVDAVSDTAGVIENHIKMLYAGLNALYRPTDRLTLTGLYSYRSYSDDNDAHDVTGALSVLVWRKPAAVAAGYRIRYMNYHRQSGHGYFDPSDFLANLVFVNVSYEDKRFYGYIEPYGGYQSFTRNNEGNYSLVAGGAGLLGWRFSKHVAVEATAEGGNYAVGSTGAYNYYQVGARVILTY